MQYWNIYDDEFGIMVHIAAETLEEAEGIADTLDFSQLRDGEYIDVTDDIANYVE